MGKNIYFTEPLGDGEGVSAERVFLSMDKLLQLVVEADEDGVDLCFRNAAHRAVLRLVIVRPASPRYIAAFCFLARKIEPQVSVK